MKKTVNVVLFLVLLTGPLTLWGQDANVSAEEILGKTMRYFQNEPSFEMNLEYTLFRDMENPVLIEKYTGVLAKDGNNSHLKINETEFIIQGTGYLKINHEQKAMQYEAVTKEALATNMLDVSKYVSLFAEKEVFKEEGRWRCELTAPRFTQLPYGKVVLYINAETFQMEKQILTLVTPAAIKDEKGALTKDLKYLEIAIKKVSTTYDKVSYFNIDQFIQRKGKTMIASQKYSQYQLINNRIN